VNECDFCEAKVKHLNPINNDLWAICDTCMELHYRIMPAVIQANADRKLCGHGVPYADCGCEEE